MEKSSYDDAVTRLGGAPGDMATSVLDRYSEPQRGYHDGRHLAEVLTAVDLLGGDLDPRDHALVVLAAWYHDAVYDPVAASGANEEASAVLAERELATAGCDPSAAGAVAGLVRATLEHDLPGTPGPEAVLHDADLWVLSAPPQRFDEYCAQVRDEYAHVPAEDFARGRTAVLAPFATRPRLYATPLAHERWTDAARTNLRRELDRLSGGAGGAERR
ncbi:hypothetical protein EEW87_005620 [Janibacter melonis]|uniref:Metal-dependent phosphohydrolase n=1 Tax=Janibacter melonis TaxID=262209 RepID=A0A5P8FK71_9MICO|nr:hypothetical protein [Janibacter melonis]QFQ29917.2 hypothetical protein EEW87_005620 [Janibacter melonis]